jgi:uncharacterized protein (TIGR00106 family)
MLVAFSVSPVGTGEAVGAAVAEAVRVVRASGLPNRTDAMFTTIEGEWDEVMAVVKAATDAVAAAAPRVSLVLKADIRPGHEGEMTAKLDRLEAALGRATIRPAESGDAEGLARVHVQAWRESYTHLLSPDFLAGLSVPRRQEVWRQLLANPAESCVVAVAGGEVVGFCATHSCGDGPRDLELWGIYVLASWHGTGVAQRLVDAAVGDRPCYLWVAEDNPRAHAFYRRNGFAPDGTRQIADTLEGMATVRMIR